MTWTESVDASAFGVIFLVFFGGGENQILWDRILRETLNVMLISWLIRDRKTIKNNLENCEHVKVLEDVLSGILPQLIIITTITTLI